MSDIAELSELLGVIYDASLDAGRWPLAIERAAAFLNCMGGMIGAYDVLQKGADVRAVWGYEPRFLETFDYYTSINPTLRLSFRMKVGEVCSVEDFIPIADFHNNRVYQEWAAPQGIVDVVQTTLERSPLALAALAFSRHARHGLVDASTRERMALIAPHFRRSVLIGKVVDLARIEAGVFSDAIDGLAAAVFLVAADGRLLHANASAERMLAAADPFRRIEGILTTNSPKAQRGLMRSFAAAAEGDAAGAAVGAAIPIVSKTGERFAGHVLPMTAGRRRVRHCLRTRSRDFSCARWQSGFRK